MAEDKAIVVVFTGRGMGSTEAQELKDKLTTTFLRLLLESGNLPRAICFYTDGVELTCEGSPVLAELAALEGRGVRLVICSTCLGYFGLTEKVRVGVVGGMPDILAAMQAANSAITV